jgi:uncharacterized protein YukJ
VSNFSFPFDF